MPSCCCLLCLSFPVFRRRKKRGNIPSVRRRAGHPLESLNQLSTTKNENRTATMSSSLVRKLLRATDVDAVTKSSSQQSSSVDAVVETKSQIRKRQRKEALNANTPLATEQDIVDAHVRSMLMLDGQSARWTRDIKLNKTVPKRKRQKSETIVTNSRGSAAQSKSMAHHHVPTFNKKRHKAELQKASVEKIAKLLKKSGKKPW